MSSSQADRQRGSTSFLAGGGDKGPDWSGINPKPLIMTPPFSVSISLVAMGGQAFKLKGRMKSKGPRCKQRHMLHESRVFAKHLHSPEVMIGISSEILDLATELFSAKRNHRRFSCTNALRKVPLLRPQRKTHLHHHYGRTHIDCPAVGFSDKSTAITIAFTPPAAACNLFLNMPTSNKIMQIVDEREALEPMHFMNSDTWHFVGVTRSNLERAQVLQEKLLRRPPGPSRLQREA
ncbi:unnamed protein product [Pleuronectes platessa]|uniref:Uncharacterized protein n=1 Tax=Pleuronectes platessa TaxID=8262 RepID=A0A9N7VNP1_PLEPL|nr:unnamed protein product [Pleuronectes platessa]